MLLKLRRAPYHVRRVGGRHGVGVTVHEQFLNVHGESAESKMKVFEYLDEHGVLHIVPEDQEQSFLERKRGQVDA